MAISEAARHDLYTGLRDVTGPERAETLMSAIPLHDVDEVVTKADLRAEIAELRSELRTGLAHLETKIEAQQVALNRHLNRLVVAVLVSIVGSMLGVGFLS
jgi:hypothetical protein